MVDAILEMGPMKQIECDLTEVAPTVYTVVKTLVKADVPHDEIASVILDIMENQKKMPEGLKALFEQMEERLANEIEQNYPTVTAHLIPTDQYNPLMGTVEDTFK